MVGAAGIGALTVGTDPLLVPAPRKGEKGEQQQWQWPAGKRREWGHRDCLRQAVAKHPHPVAGADLGVQRGLPHRQGG